MRVIFMRTPLILDPAQHLSGSFRGLRSGNSVHADQQENLRIIGRHEHHGKAVAGGTPGVSTQRRSSFDENVGRGKRSMHLRASSMPSRESHPVENLAHAGLLALVRQFEVSVSQP